MVLHFFDRIFGNSGDPKAFLKSHQTNQYIEAGFTESEAKELAWLSSRS
jgi:hypothetical protein